MSGPSPADPGPDSLPPATRPIARPAGAPAARAWGDVPADGADSFGAGNTVPGAPSDQGQALAGERGTVGGAQRESDAEPPADDDADTYATAAETARSGGSGGASARQQTGAEPLRQRGSGSAEPGLRMRLSTGSRRALRAGVEWLDRPMTSLHLVLAIFALLLGFGLLMVLSSSSVSAYERSGSSFAVFQNQATFATIGLLGFFLTQYLPVRVMRGVSTWAVIGSLLLLVVVLVPGVGAKLNGARSWIEVGTFRFQPAEIAKLALLLWAAHVLASRRHMLGSVKALLVPVLPVFLLMGLLLMAQPDLGTTVALSIVFFAVLYFAGAPGWLFGVVAGLGVAGLCGLALTAPYRWKRVTTFLNPEGAGDAGYQLRQSLYGMGNGGWFGVGLGQSRAKWSYLPNADSDFVYAIVGEELGLVGAGLVLVLFALLAYTGLRIARRSVDPFAKIVCSAATVWLVGQAAINIGYVIGLLPVTGIPLPMISVGGTSLIITMLVFGLLANFARREPEALVATDAGEGGRLARFLGLRPDGAAAARARRAQRRRDRELRRGPVTAGPTRPGPAAPAPARPPGDTRQTGLRRPVTHPRDAREPRELREGEDQLRTSRTRPPPGPVPSGRAPAARPASNARRDGERRDRRAQDQREPEHRTSGSRPAQRGGRTR